MLILKPLHHIPAPERRSDTYGTPLESSMITRTVTKPVSLCAAPNALIYSPALRHPGGESHGESAIGGGRFRRSGSAEAPSRFSLGGGTFAASSCSGRLPVEKQRIPTAGARQHAEPCEFRVCGSEEHRALVWAGLGNGGLPGSGPPGGAQPSPKPGMDQPRLALATLHRHE